MLPLVTNGNTDASTTRSPSVPWTHIEVGSTTAASSVPILAVHDGCSAVSASRATQSRISWSVSTPAPGEISPPLNAEKAGWSRIVRAARTISIHSRRSASVER